MYLFGGWRMWTNIFFFFQAEDGIRDYKVTGVQTCALPISALELAQLNRGEGDMQILGLTGVLEQGQGQTDTGRDEGRLPHPLVQFAFRVEDFGSQPVEQASSQGG